MAASKTAFQFCSSNVKIEQVSKNGFNVGINSFLYFFNV